MIQLLYFGKQTVLQKIKLELPYDPTILLLGIYIPKRIESMCPHKILYARIYSSIIYNREEAESTPNVHQLINAYINCGIFI